MLTAVSRSALNHISCDLIWLKNWVKASNLINSDQIVSEFWSC
ncbi:hypothetical protein J500_2933 [Acinetobacter sp. 479375]|nr:hypothetical protein J500_2933 [Acinetobacter sp. 479375]BBF77121.1 hypothetical protein URS_1100 [Acinetobacter ursingii]